MRLITAVKKKEAVADSADSTVADQAGLQRVKEPKTRLTDVWA